jgi:hypothetical protein
VSLESIEAEMVKRGFRPGAAYTACIRWTKRGQFEKVGMKGNLLFRSKSNELHPKIT